MAGEEGKTHINSVSLISVLFLGPIFSQCRLSSTRFITNLLRFTSVYVYIALALVALIEEERVDIGLTVTAHFF